MNKHDKERHKANTALFMAAWNWVNQTKKIMSEYGLPSEPTTQALIDAVETIEGFYKDDISTGAWTPQHGRN